MKKVLLIFIGFLPILARAVPEPSVYPNSGSTDARIDENTDISPFPSPPLSPDAQKQEEKNSAPKKGDDFVKGPYDKNGNYRYVPEVKEEKEI